MRHGFERQVDALDQRLDDFARLRALNADYRPLLGGGGEPDLPFREFRLEIVLHHVENPRRAASRRRHMEAVFGNPPDHAIVINEAVLAAHDPVAAHADGEFLPRVGVHQFHELDGVRPHHLDLAEGGSIENAGRLAGGLAFAGNGCVHVLTGARKVPGAFPVADILEYCAMFLSP